MTDIGILLMTSDKRVIFAKNAKDSAPKLMIVKHYQDDPVARIKALYGLDIVMSDEDAIPVHKINMKLRRRALSRRRTRVFSCTNRWRPSSRRWSTRSAGTRSAAPAGSRMRSRSSRKIEITFPPFFAG